MSDGRQYLHICNCLQLTADIADCRSLLQLALLLLLLPAYAYVLLCAITLLLGSVICLMPVMRVRSGCQ